MDLNTVSELIGANAEAIGGWRNGDAWLAGGTWLFSEPQRELRRLLDLTALRWEPLRQTEDGLEIAATCTLAKLAGWPGRPDWPGGGLVGDCCRALLGSLKIWNAATVGGNLCLALPAGPMTSLAVALDAVHTVWGPDGEPRTLPARELVLDAGVNALAPGELLRSTRLPASSLRSLTAFRQLSLTPVGRSAAVVIGRWSPDQKLVITVTASVAVPVQISFPGMPEAAELREALRAAIDEFYEDPHGDPAWREHLTLMFAEEVRAELRDAAAAAAH
jgi:CO/xanthine dehydrogenase FAD-binding subunit